MGLTSSFEIGSILGIRVRAHVLLLVLFAVIFFSGAAQGDGLFRVCLSALLFAIVLLHELGHCLVARALGVRVIDITLWPLGGMARMAAMPESSRTEALVAVAGPAVNFVLALVALPFFVGAALLDAEATLGTLGAELLAWFVYANLVMGAFNLLPAFPMDGGRLLRAFLGRRGAWLSATETAVAIGRWIALLLALLGIFGWPGLLPPSFALPLVALFLWWSGRAELTQVRARHATPQSSERSEPVSGFTPERIAELERFRGRLSRYRTDEGSP